MRRPGRSKGIAVIPTLLTLGNGFCGFVAMAKVLDAIQLQEGALFQEKLLQAAWLVFLAMVFDALDGRVARLTNQTSEFGAQLDSFTDLISFGLAPALMVKVIYEHAMLRAGLPFSGKFTLLLTALYAVCSVLRLARFTVDTEPDAPAHNTFLGLPTPAAAGVVAGAVLFLYNGGDTFPFLREGAVISTLERSLLFLPPLLGLLMISKVEYVHFFNRYVRGRKTFNFFVQGLLCLFLIAFCHEWALFLCFLAYLFSGPVASGIQLGRTARARLAARYGTHRGEKG